jgi:hypothetical protein
MRTAFLLCATVLLPTLTAAQGQQPPLTYHGWALGISLDSATKLTRAQIGKPLVCVGNESETMFCQTEPGLGAHASIYFSPMPRRIEEMSLLIPFDRRASRDSLKTWLSTRWGAEIAREVIGGKSTSPGPVEITTDPIGSWAREGMRFGMVAIASVDTVRTLSVSLYSPAREIRLMQQRRQQRADTSKRR